MIIDLTRQFSEEEYESYCKLVDFWWDKLDEYRYDLNYAEDLGLLYDEEEANLQEPTCFLDLISYYTPELESINLNRIELEHLDRLCKKIEEFVDELKFKHNFCSEIFLPQCTEKKNSMLKFLEDRNASYFLICRLHPASEEVLLIRDPDVCREFKILFQSYRILEDNANWLVDARGWVGIDRVDSLDYRSLFDWLNNNCIGYWRPLEPFSNSYSWRNNVYQKIYFQYESDLILYVLRFKGNKD